MQDPAFGLLFFWYYLEDVPVEFGPTRFWPTKQGGNGTVKSFDQQVYTGPTVAGPAFETGLPAGSLVIFTSSTIHGRNSFKVPYGQRYVRMIVKTVELFVDRYLSGSKCRECVLSGAQALLGARRQRLGRAGPNGQYRATIGPSRIQGDG